MKLGMIVATRGQFLVYETLDNEGELNGYAVVGPGRSPINIANVGEAIYLAEKLDAFSTKPIEEVIRKYPELAGAYAALVAIEKKTESDNLTPEQRAAVMTRVRQNVINSIERGNSITMKIKEQTEVIQESAKPEIKQDRGLER